MACFFLVTPVSIDRLTNSLGDACESCCFTWERFPPKRAHIKLNLLGTQAADKPPISPCLFKLAAPRLQEAKSQIVL